MIVVSDTSPLTALLTIGEIELLSKLFGEVIIPVAVQSELLRSHSNFPTWLRVEVVQNSAGAAAFQKIVDAGEAEAIQLAKELRADRLLIDDFRGRRLAQNEGIPLIGLLGVVLLAKTNGLIPSARILLNRLQSEADVYLAEEIIAAALKTIGE